MKQAVARVELVPSLPPPKSPGPQRDRDVGKAIQQQTRHVGFELIPWRLQPLELPPLRRTRPPRTTLTTWDIRVRRYTSPREAFILPTLLSPLPPSPSPFVGDTTRRDARTQTLPPSRVHRGTQVASTDTADKGTDSEWETQSVASQTEPPEPERSYTPPGTPPALRRNKRAKSAPHSTSSAQARAPRHSRSQYGPVRWTLTRPSISWCERATPKE